VRAFRDAGGAYLGADRLGNNLAPGLPLKESLMIHAFRRGRRGIFLDMAYLNSWCRKIMNKAGINRSVSDKATSFSGGMLQRVLLAREFAENASLIVLAEPGSGLDKIKRSKLEDELRVLTGAGAAVLLFSTDMEELTSVADEIMELKNGELSATVNRSSYET
jgi:simple sugar transport system ATP-binding protein